MVHVGDSHGFVVRSCGSFIMLLATAAHLFHWLDLDALQTPRGAPQQTFGDWTKLFLSVMHLALDVRDLS